MPCRSSQRLTGQLVAKPRIIPICIKNQWLELSIGGGDSQIAYSATAIHCGSPACLALAYRPVRVIPFTILIALIAAAIGGRHQRLAAYAVGISGACFIVGTFFAIITNHPIF